MENSKRITTVFFRELTDLELMLSMTLFPDLIQTFPRNNYKLDAMCLDLCASMKKFLDVADTNGFRYRKSGTANIIKAREAFYTKLKSLVEYLTIIEERERQAHQN